MSTRAARPRATMRDVAALSGVSLKTVSRVVNGETTVAPELASRVRRAAEQLSYRHNLTASALRSGGQTRTIGLLTEDVGNPFSSSLHRAIEDAASERGVSVLAVSVNEDPVRERRLALELVSRRVDGLIIVPASEDHGYLYEERQAGTAVVFLDRPSLSLDADTVVADNRGGAAEAVRHLIRHGHRDIAFLGDLERIWTARERHLGYLETLRARRIAVRPELVVHDLSTMELARDAAGLLLDGPDRPTAFFCSQNLVTIGTIAALRARRLQHEIALVGYDDDTVFDLVDPGVTAVAQDPTALGRAAAELLFARLNGDESTSQHVVMPTRLVVRGSGEIRPKP